MLDYLTIGKKNKVIVVTKKGTIEGRIAAWVAKKSLGGQMIHVEAADSVKLPDLAGHDVLILGVAFTKEGLDVIRIEANDYLLLHNDWALVEKLHGVRGVKIDHEKTVARLAWEFLHLDEAPWLVDYTEDSKLWRWGTLIDPVYLKAAIEKKYPTSETYDALATRDVSGLSEEGFWIVARSKQGGNQKSGSTKTEPRPK